LRIGLAGISDAGRGFSMCRLNPSFGHVIACYSGYGSVLINGRWQRCTPGTCYLAPPGVPHAYHTLGAARWSFAWVWSLPPLSGETPLINCDQPLLIRAETNYLRSAIEGLYRESIGPAQSTVLDHWIELVHSYTARLGRGAGASDPHELIALWERVDSDLAYPWTLPDLAATVGFSAESLRRLCQRQFGHGPMHHVTHLRVRRASMLLESTQQKVSAVAPLEFRRKRSRPRRLPANAIHERTGGGMPPINLHQRSPSR
jgi:AraC-like DNA-binding protein